MLSMHLPRGAVEQKMRTDGLDPSVLDMDPEKPAPLETPPNKIAKEAQPGPEAGGITFLDQIKSSKGGLEDYRKSE